MRISEATAKTIVEIAYKHFGSNAQVRLFGSRLDDHARGGDIDIHIFAPGSSYQDEIGFLVDIDEKLDEKVDLRVQKKEVLLIDSIARKNGVLLSV